MKPQLVYVIGQPGSGKTTLVAGLTAGLACEEHRKPFAHLVWGWSDPVCELGARREGFGGTDALGMSVQPLVEGWLQNQPHRYILAEGDRLANSKFFRAAVEAGYELTVIRLAVSAAVAEQRRAARAAALQSPLQNNAWLKGRTSKVRALAETWEANLIPLNADAPADVVLAELLAHELPLIELLRSQA